MRNASESMRLTKENMDLKMVSTERLLMTLVTGMCIMKETGIMVSIY